MSAAAKEKKEKEKAKKKAAKKRAARCEKEAEEKEKKVKLEKEAEEEEAWYERLRLMRRCYTNAWFHPKHTSVDAAFWAWAHSENLY